MLPPKPSRYPLVTAPIRKASAGLWQRIERVLSVYDEAGGPVPFTLHVYGSGQHLRHPHLPGLSLPRP